jgi:hypothetical protein
MRGRDATIHGPEGEPVLEIAVSREDPGEGFCSAVVHFCDSKEHARALELESDRAGQVPF